MSEITQATDPSVLALLEALPSLSEQALAAFICDQGYVPDGLVRMLKDRSFAVLSSEPLHALELAAAGMRVAAACAASRPLAARGMAQALHANGRYAEALVHYDAAHSGFIESGEALEAARTLLGKVDALMYLGRYLEARQTAHGARATFAALDDQRRVARMDMNLGNIYHRLDRSAEALAAYTRARAALSLHGDAMDVAHVDHNLGNVLASLNRFEEALASYAAAETAYLREDEDAEAARTAYNRAYLHFLSGRFGQALADLERVRPAFAALGDQRHLALCDLDEAEVLLALNREDEAAALAQRAGAAFEDMAMRYEAAKACVFRAIAALDRHDLDAARLLLDEAGALFAHEENPLWQATVQMLLADLAIRLGDAQEALGRCEAAQTFLEPLAPTARAARARILRAKAQQLLGSEEAARAEAAAACAAAEVLGDHVLSYQARHLLGRLQERAGSLEDAALSFKQAMDDVDWLRGGITRDDLRISFAHDKVVLYEDAVRNALRRGRVAEAFEHVERAKARSLIDLLAGGPPIPLHADEEDTALAARVAELHDVLTALYNRLHGEGEGRQRFAEGHETLLARMRAHEEELTQVLGRLRLRQEDYASLGSVTAAGLDQIRARIGAEDALLEFFLLDDAVLVFLITDSAVRVFGPLAGRADIEAWIGQWQFHLAHFRYGPGFARRHSAGLRATARSLLQAMHTTLIAPLAEAIAGRSLLIVPHGPLHHVPFQALFDGRTFLIERHDLSYAPSATTLAVQRMKAPRQEQALIVGVPTPALPHIAEEVAAVAACRRAPVVLLEGAASRARFLVEAPRSRSVHLATHAIFRADNPLFSAVRLSDDWLTVSDIYGLDLAADLVVLSACETGASAVLHGDELIGLTRGFLYAGARSLVASLWAASDAATAALMASFYTAMEAESGVRRALRTAQREAMARNPHPYYWAPFILSGQPGA